MNRIRPFAIGFALALALVMASPGNAQKDKNVSYSGAVTGSVTAVSQTSITVKGTNNDGGTYAVTKDTQIMSGGKTIDTADIDTEDHVVVSWDYAAPNSDKKVAKLIEKTDAP